MTETLKKAIAAGLAITIGAAVYTSLENKIAGAILFSLGLFLICSFGWNLFTGKIGYVFANKNQPNVFVIWLGNLIGTVAGSGALRIARPVLHDTAAAMTQTKLSMPYVSVFLAAVFCGILMYAAVENFRKNPNSASGIFGIVFCVSVFILAGFEHSIADMCYFVIGVESAAEALKALVFVLVVSCGNACGSWLIRWLSGSLA
ncbi:MAG: formate/nitrite transporter family protein [Solobacterium sp.]|nr:formate/nitrite transporter family protein [Solobacterium sp.]